VIRPNPLDVIACEPPRFSAAEACEIARKHYGIDAGARTLVSERDQNFRLKSTDGSRWVLKIANAGEDPAVSDFQIRALQHIAGQEAVVTVPLVRLTLAGEDRLLLDRDGARHVVRLVSYLDGEPLEGKPLTAALARDCGRTLALLGQALCRFRHPGADQPLLWDMKQALALRDLLATVDDAGMRELLKTCLDDFARDALPRFPALRSQVIHNDLNPANVLVSATAPERVAGVIDFGDMQHSPLIVDLAVAASYWRNTAGDPLTLIAELVAGYHAVEPLQTGEIDLLYDLINTRLATTVLILAWRSAERRSDDAYLGAMASSESTAAEFLRRCRELPRADVSRRLREVCASVTAAG
jgi:hydroxylysine kinase